MRAISAFAARSATILIAIGAVVLALSDGADAVGAHQAAPANLTEHALRLRNNWRSGSRLSLRIVASAQRHQHFVRVPAQGRQAQPRHVHIYLRIPGRAERRAPTLPERGYDRLQR